MATYEVDQRVWVYDVNAPRGRGPSEGTVTKVGRKLVTVRDRYGHSAVYRIDGGTINDNYGHQWIRTDAERDEHERYKAAVESLRAVRVELQPGCQLTLQQVEALARDVAP